MRILRNTVRFGGVLTGVALAIGTVPAFAAGFLLNESSASGLGNAFAGGAAIAEDAGTMWSNVAGMSRIQSTQVVGALHLITPSLKFGNTGSQPALSQRLGGDGGDAGGLAAVPNLYVVTPIDKSLSIGLGMTSPWGLVTEYDQGWAGRFLAIKSSIKTYNLNPGISWKPNDSVALGLGANFQRITAEFTNQVNYSAALLGAAGLAGVAPGSSTFNAIARATPGLESSADIQGSDNAWGWNTGVLWEIDGRNRVGAQYRSSIKYHIVGNVQFVNPVPLVPASLAPLANAVNTGALYDSNVSSDVKLPAIVNLSYFTKLNDQWDLMADAQWTQWSTIKALTFVRSNGVVLQSTPENFKDVWKLALGANYRYNETWMFRGGVAFDQSPVQSEFRTPRLPDADRTWLTAGMQYSVNPKVKLDFGAGYIWVDNATIRDSGSPPNTARNGLLNGYYNSNTFILSAQLNYSF